jgi:hypothetical protein
MSEDIITSKNPHPNRTTAAVRQKPVPDIEWNNLSAKVYTDLGLEVPEKLFM